MNQQATAPRKGLHPLAWVAIGCGGLMVLALIAFVGLGFFAANKAKEFVEDIEESPVTTMAKGMAMFNPELEFVEADEAARTATFRMTETGETITINADDIKEGRISFSNDEGETTFDMSGEGDSGSMTVTQNGETVFEAHGDASEDGGTLTITSDDGETSFVGGQAAIGEMPDWVQLYPGATVTGAASQTSDSGVDGTVSFTTSASTEDILTYYSDAFESSGFRVDSRTINEQPSGPTTGLMRASRTKEKQTIVLTVVETDQTTGSVQFSDKN